MRLRDVMTPDPVAVAADAPLRDAIDLLEGGAVRHLPVLEGDRLVGIVSDRDLRPWRRVALDGRSELAMGLGWELLRTPVRSFMRTDVIFLGPEREVGEAVDALLDFEVGALPVVDQGRLVGMVSYVDLLRLLQELLDQDQRLTA
jgi:acetoin utilization protein AcuB